MCEEGGCRMTDNLTTKEKVSKKPITEKCIKKTHTLLFRLNDFLNWLIILVSTNSPTWGNFVLIIATSAANTGVNGKLAAWAFMILLANNPLPRIRFSENSSGTICLILVMFTRLTIPVMDLRRASQESRWYSALVLSKDAASCIARKRAGGMYIPPERVFKSFANSARWAVSRSFSVSFSFESDFESSIAATRVSRCWSLLASLVDRESTSLLASDGDRDLRRVEGGPSTSDDWDCDLFEKKKLKPILKTYTSRYDIPFPFVVCLCCWGRVHGWG